jgi:hypothetical protein
MHAFKLGLSALVAALLLAACGGGGGGGSGGTPAPGMATAKVSFGFPANPVVPLAPMGTVSQIASLTLDVVETNGETWASGQAVGIGGVPSSWSATVTVPQGVELTFTGNAFNEASDLIFTGTGTGTADSGTLPVTIGMASVDNESDITPPTMTLSGVVSCPVDNTGCDATNLLEGSSVVVTVDISGTPGTDVTVGGTGDNWSPSGPQSVTLVAGFGTIDLTWTAPTGSGGGAPVLRSILLESGTLGLDYAAVETGVSFAVAATANTASSFAFGPVITGVTGMNTGTVSAPNNNFGTGTDLLLTVTTEATGLIDLDASLTQTTEGTFTNTASNLGVPATGGEITMQGYAKNASGTLDVTATDAGGLSTTNTYTLVVGQYPAPVDF